jgi:LysR family glycine cleavage system transcriptional activator
MAAITHLGSLQALELAVRTGSLKAAADVLHVTPAAVGQRIKLLEDYLGVELLVRGRSGIRPTRELEAALTHLNIAFRELEATATLLDFQRGHELQIVADPDWADLWLRPRLADFRAISPNTRFCINGVGDVPVRLGQADCEIWFGSPRGRGAEYELFTDYLMPVGSPENTVRIGRLPAEERLEGFPLLHLECYAGDPGALGWPEWIARFGHRRTGLDRGIRYRTVGGALDAVYSSPGLIICGLSLVAPACLAGQLALPFPLVEGGWTSHAYRISFRDGALRRSQTAQFRDWLVGEASASAEALRRHLDQDKERL